MMINQKIQQCFSFFFHKINIFWVKYQYKITQYNNINLKLLVSQLEKLKSVTENATGVTLRLSKVTIYNDKTNFPQKLLLTDRQTSNICRSFANNSAINVKFSKTFISTILQLGRFLEPLLKIYHVYHELTMSLYH